MSAILPETMRDNPRWKKQQDGSYIPHPEGNIYAPHSAKEENIGRMDEDNVLVMANKRLCGACAKPFSDDEEVIFFLANFFAKPIHREPPMHCACAGYAARLCPNIRTRPWNYTIVATRYWSAEIYDEDVSGPQSPPFNTPCHFVIDESKQNTIMEYQEFLNYSAPTRQISS